MSELLLHASTGRPTGTRSSRRLRSEGHVPAVVYGLGEDPVAITVVWSELRKVLTTDAGVNALLTLEIEGNQQLSIVKDIQRHPTRRDVIHVDFIRLDANADIEVEVPLILVGEARKVEQVSGMVDQTSFSIAVLSKPNAIPTEVTADISELEVGETITIADIQLPEGVRAAADPDETVASAVVTRSTIEAMRADEAAEAAAEAGEAGGAPAADGDDSEGGED